MGAIPKRVKDRLEDALKHYQPILQSAKDRDINEADTVTIIKDILSDLFGWDKYAEVTSEFSIRNTYCDLAVKIENNVKLLIEVKAVNVDLKENHVRQATDYAANHGIEWVALTNGVVWQVFRMKFGQPVSSDLALELDLLKLSHKNAEHIESLFLLAKEARIEEALKQHHEHRQAVNRFSLGAILQTEPVITIVRRELKRLFPEAKPDLEEVQSILRDEVMKREVLENENTTEILKKAERLYRKMEKSRQDVGGASDGLTQELQAPPVE